MMATLLALAKETAGDKRRELLRSVADLFIDGEQDYSDRELVLFGEVIGDLLDLVDLDGRVELSNKIADCDRSTGDLHLRLAEDDEIKVAGPVLAGSPLFDDDTLVDLAERKSQGHLLAISKRSRLSIKVTDVLVERGENDVVCSVTGNLGADLSDTSYERIIEKAASDPALQAAISYRADMPVALVEKVLTILPDEHRERLVGLIDENPDQAADLFATADEKAKTMRLEQAKRRLQTKGMAVQIRDGIMDLDGAVLLLGREDRYQNMALLLAEFARLKESIVLSNLFKIDHDAIVILLRALDLSERAVAIVAQMRCRRLNLPESMKDRMLEAWRTLDEQTAGKVLQLTRLRSAA